MTYILEGDPYLKQGLLLLNPYITTLNVFQAYTLKRIRDPSFQDEFHDYANLATLFAPLAKVFPCRK